MQADSVRMALLTTDAQTPDLILSDLGLPDGSGHDLLRPLVASGKGIKAIVLSGYGVPAGVQKSLDAGFIEYLTKPVDSGALRQALLRLVGTPNRRPM